jgi:hypothetical protein
MKHTPGPWKAINKYTVVRDAGDPTPRIIVQTTISGECGLYDGNADEANARLIAAAPDMLAMLEELEWFRASLCMTCGNFKFDDHEPDCKLGNLLKKVKGA